MLVFTATYEKGGRILLDSNKLTGLDRAVFQLILDFFVKNGFPASSTFISFSNSKNIRFAFFKNVFALIISLFHLLSRLVFRSYQLRHEHNVVVECLLRKRRLDHQQQHLLSSRQERNVRRWEEHLYSEQGLVFTNATNQHHTVAVHHQQTQKE